MTPRERVLATFAGQDLDRIPRFEIWIDALLNELGEPDPAGVYAAVGQDCIMMPSRFPPGSNAWRTGVDEWGRVWRDGIYADGVVDTQDDLERFSPPLELVEQRFEQAQVAHLRHQFPDHCLIFGTHVGPFMASYMAMGFSRFFLRLFDNRHFVHHLMEKRTEWCIALYQKAISLGAEILVLGDDAAHGQGPMISPAMWREYVLPYHLRIAQALDRPVIWHSDGNIKSLLPMAVEAGFAGVHGIEPAAGMDLAEVKGEFGQDLVLIGNVDVNILCQGDLSAVRQEVDRSLAQGSPGGRYMFSTCNSIFSGMNPEAVKEMFRYSAEVNTR